MAIKQLQDADALLLYKVGPVYCCSPTLTVEAVILPPKLTHAPGYSEAEPGVFKHACGIVHVVDLRKRFGVESGNWKQPGKIVVVEVEGGYAGFWVDEILDVIHFPEKGWSSVPAGIPKTVFKRTLLLNNNIQLYCDFEALFKFKETGYLREYIAHLHSSEETKRSEITKENDSKKEYLRSVENVKNTDKKPAVDMIAKEKSSGSRVKEFPVDDSKDALVDKKIPVVKKDYKPVDHRPTRESKRDFISAADANKKLKNQFSYQSELVTNKHEQSIDAEEMSIDQGELNFQAKEDGNDIANDDSSNGIFWLVVFVSIVATLSGFGYLFVFDSDKKTYVEETELKPLVKKMPVKPEVDILIKEEIAPQFNEVVEPDDGRYHAEVNRHGDVLTIIVNEPVTEIKEKNNTSEDEVVVTEVEVTKEQDLKSVNEKEKIPEVVRTHEIIHVVIKGDTLWHIARRYINDPYRYPELARLSKIKNPDLIYPGDKVKIVINRIKE